VPYYIAAMKIIKTVKNSLLLTIEQPVTMKQKQLKQIKLEQK